MTTKPELALAEALAHHKTAQAAYAPADAAHDEEASDYLSAAHYPNFRIAPSRLGWALFT